MSAADILRDREAIRRTRERRRMRDEARRRLERIRRVTEVAQERQIDAGLLLRLGDALAPWTAFRAGDGNMSMGLRSGDELALRALDMLREAKP